MNFEKKRNIIFVLFLLIMFSILSFSCIKKEYKYSDVAYFAEPIIQDFCAGFTKNDYNEFANYFTLYFSKPIPQESLVTLFTKIGTTIGSYVPNSISYKSVKKVKNIFIIEYTASFTDETEPVSIILNFEKSLGEFKLVGFTVDSPKLRNTNN
ncbi:MAG: hypothetical protein GYA61_01900 [Spirochaetales bacterium]|jgi:uncharacterized membrane protein YjdF|nr:hypothetical protein [Exilispira sp.]NMC66956.1 hypothetical protein [Spirochaetales bacterium]